MATVLLVIDVQQALVDALPAARREELLSTLARLIARARDTGTPVVYVRHEDEELVPDTPPWEIAGAIAPHAGDPSVAKRFRDAFRETALRQVLDGFAADHLVVCGMQTEFCIDATIREAERRGYGVTLVADGHATYAVDGASEEQIRAQIHRVARGSVARIVPSDALFVPDLLT